jgi:hypothetical protein
VVLSEAGIELDHHVDGAALSRKPLDPKRCRQQAPSNFGHHRLGQDEPAAADRPGRLQGGTVIPVTALDDRGGRERPDPERPRRRPTNHPAEYRLPVKAGQAEPVDGALAGDHGSGPSVAQQPVVPDRRRTVDG